MAFRVQGLRVESRNLTVFAQGTVGDIEVTENPSDCGVPPDPPCCGATYDSSIYIAAEGPLRSDFSSFVGDWVLDWDGERQSWAGSVQSGTIEISTELWCEEDPELGQVWWLSGWYTTEDRESVPFLVSGDTDGETILFSIEVSGTDSPLTVVVGHPCPSGAAGGSGEAINCNAGCLINTATVSDKTGDCTCLPNTLTYNGPSGDAIATWSTSTCPGNLSYSLRCVDGTYKFYANTDECTLVSYVNSPFSATYQLPALGANCGGSGGTAKVTVSCS